MGDTATRSTTELLIDLGTSRDEQMWSVLDRRYRPIVSGVARKLGLDDTSAEDVAQETMYQLARDLRAGKFDRGKGRLRGWVIGITRHRVIDTLRARGPRKDWRGSSAVEQVASEREVTLMWNDERRATILREAMESVRENSKSAEDSIRAFEMIALERRQAGEVADELGLSVDQVYVIKNRMTARVREEVERLTALYDD